MQVVRSGGASGMRSVERKDGSREPALGTNAVEGGHTRGLKMTSRTESARSSPSKGVRPRTTRTLGVLDLELQHGKFS